MMTPAQKERWMRQESARIANESSLQDIQTKLAMLRQERLDIINGVRVRSGTAYSGLTARIMILADAEIEKLLQESSEKKTTRSH